MESKITDRFRFAYIMSLLGGFLGAYSYIVRGGIFASAQTGNLIQLSLKMVNGNFTSWYLHVFPIMMFGCGVIVCEHLKNKVGNKNLLHWMECVLLIEGAVLVLIAFIPVGNLNVYANMLIGFIVGVQTQCVRVIGGVTLMTTMLTGNARTISEHLYYYFNEKEKDIQKLRLIIKQFGVIFSFITGVLVGGFLTASGGQYSIVYGLVFIVLAECMVIIYRKSLFNN